MLQSQSCWLASRAAAPKSPGKTAMRQRSLAVALQPEHLSLLACYWYCTESTPYQCIRCLWYSERQPKIENTLAVIFKLRIHAIARNYLNNLILAQTAVFIMLFSNYLCNSFQAYVHNIAPNANECENFSSCPYISKHTILDCFRHVFRSHDMLDDAGSREY